MYRLLKDSEIIAAGDRFDYWQKNNTPFIEVGLGYPQVGAFGSARIGYTVLEAKKVDGSDDLRVRRKVDAAYVVKHFAAVQEANNSQNVEIGRLRQLLANKSDTSLLAQLTTERLERNRALDKLLASECTCGDLVATLDAERSRYAYLESECEVTSEKLVQAKLDNTRLKESLASTLTRADTVALIEAQFKGLITELKDAKAELAILRPRDAAYYLRIQRLEAELRELEQPRYRDLFTGERLQAGDECLVAGRWQAMPENVIQITDCNNAGVNAGYFFRRKIV